jgi:hypothetical protein
LEGKVKGLETERKTMVDDLQGMAVLMEEVGSLRK